MSYTANEGWATQAGVGSGLRCYAESIQPKTFASGTGTLAALTPVTYNTSTGFWQIFRGQVNEVNTVTANATPASDGTWTLTVNGQTTAAMDHDIDAAGIQAALEALSNVSVGDVTVAMTNGTDLGDSSAVAQISWGGDLAGQDITITIGTGSLTGNVHVLATSTAGGADEANGTQLIQGFVWPDAITLSASGEVLGNVVLAGRIHVDDIPSEVDGVYGQVELLAALRSGDVRRQGFIIEGLSQFH